MQLNFVECCPYYQPGAVHFDWLLFGKRWNAAFVNDGGFFGPFQDSVARRNYHV